ncbi:hypothetical protein BDK92_1510 [Micromonospora pisi]|uniref:Mce-associated membrane protein n=1 Tax=Micromonospora pisi TaxID=589240 RepID=A0A495JE08_9ACTN|nr:hypothetical protein [Micromonospora pisi]RKR87236.1 hypothetical protein BDK92_1510 [Micromonospora pisi]
MGTRWRCLVGPVGPLALLPLGLAACGDGGAAGRSTPAGTPTATATVTGAGPDDGPEKARARVQAYLDAMGAKDVPAGRAQLCTPMRAAFDRAATGRNGDFADHFTVSRTSIVDVRANAGQIEVSTEITVAVGGTARAVRILFTVVRAEADWCIANETVGGATAPAPSGSPAGARR